MGTNAKLTLTILVTVLLLFQGAARFADDEEEVKLPERVKASINRALRYLARTQQKDGSWINSESNKWREQDPNLATGYALLVLSYVK